MEIMNRPSNQDTVGAPLTHAHSRTHTHAQYFIPSFFVTAHASGNTGLQLMKSLVHMMASRLQITKLDFYYEPHTGISAFGEFQLVCLHSRLQKQVLKMAITN